MQDTITGTNVAFNGASFIKPEEDFLALIRTIARCFPVRVPIAGRTRDRLFGVLDRTLRFTTSDDVVRTPYGDLRIDPAHEPERLLSYLYHNVFAYYRTSELGLYMGRVAEPRATFVDVGANLGMFALVARSYGFATVVVEPEPKHAAFLTRNAEVFGTVIPVALSDQPGALPLYYEQGNSGSMSLFATDAYQKGGEVPVTTFSELARQGKLGRPENIRLVKIDVEGFEAPMVRGMQELLQTGVRPHLWCELRGDRSGRNGGSFRLVRECLSEYGYRMMRLRKGRELPTTEQALAELGVFDALFVPVGS